MYIVHYCQNRNVHKVCLKLALFWDWLL